MIKAKGFDLSYFQGDVSSSDFSCLKSNGYDFGIIEASKGSEYGLNPYSELKVFLEFALAYFVASFFCCF